MTTNKLPPAVVPTDPEMKAIATKWWEPHKHINFADWNDTLKQHTYPFKIVPIDAEFIDLVLAEGSAFQHETALAQFKSLIRPALKKMNCENSFFIKLITRSPKDWLFDENNSGKPKPCSSIGNTLLVIRNSMRCFEDLCILKYLPKHAALVIRPYIDFKPRNEWRVYIQDKKIVGISQYYYQETFPNIKVPEKEMRSFINDIVIPNIELNDFVADLIMEDKPILLEMNPWGLSDPCLFYDYQSFDGTLKYNKA